MRIEPKVIIERLLENQLRIRETARNLSISPGTVINWKKEAASIFNRLKLKTRGLKRKSTRPKSIRSTTLLTTEQDRIVGIREDTGFCAQKIQSILRLNKHHRTIHRFLKKKDLIKTTGYHRRPLFQDTKHMHAKNVKTIGKLQMDVKYVTPELSGLDHTCYLYALLDILSRYKQGVILPLLDQEYSIQALRFIMPNLPFKADFIQTDNGLEFQNRFQDFVKNKLHFKHHYIHKSNPNENAVIERSFRTDEEEFFFFRLGKLGKPQDISQLNIFYQIYLKEYNEVRPHLSLNMLTPLEKLKSVQ